MRILPRRTTDRVSNWMLWRWMEIDGRKPGVKYLTRLYVVQTPWFGVKLHWFHAPDPDEACHDHPWSFVSILLRGRYQERRQTFRRTGLVLLQETERQRWGCLDTAYRRAEDVHRITLVAPGTLTLVLNGPKRKSWGFYQSQGKDTLSGHRFNYVPWREHLGIPKDAPEV